jgi:4-diphosphocytidyl-2-C-methyl-D-erythritol kinase
MLTIAAPAKLNLTLEVLDKRPDGYHEIRSVVQMMLPAGPENHPQV